MQVGRAAPGEMATADKGRPYEEGPTKKEPAEAEDWLN
jgi:hypothetical protein